MAVQQVAFTSDDKTKDRPFGLYCDEETWVMLMDLVIADFDKINAKSDKTDEDWKKWRLLKDTQFKMTTVHYKYQRGQTTEEPLSSGFDVDTNDPNLAAF